MSSATDAYEEKKKRLSAQLQSHSGEGVRLKKKTSNLFRDRRKSAERPLDVRDFNHVLEVSPEQAVVDVEGMTPYSQLVDECLRYGVMPTVVPELRSITIGGAVTGLGIESSSFKYGLVHETVEELEILLPDGRVVVARPDNEHRDLFFGFPNSYGTLGYALRVRVKTVPVKPYVQLNHHRFDDARAFFSELAQWADRDIDFLDGTVFSPGEMYITVGEFVDDAPFVSDYTYENIYYQSIRERETDYLTVHDYIWRWDTDWFWCSKNVFAQNPIVRRLLGRSRLNSVTYTKIMRWNTRLKLTHYINRLLGLHAESVIQDVQVPIERAAEFLDFYFETIRFTPVWVCPTRLWDKERQYPLYPLKPDELYVNFGFWDVIKDKQQRPAGYYNRAVEGKVMELGGMKSLYSDSYFPREQFWEIYNKPAYDELKRTYDPSGRLKNLYDKCVLGG